NDTKLALRAHVGGRRAPHRGLDAAGAPVPRPRAPPPQRVGGAGAAQDGDVQPRLGVPSLLQRDEKRPVLAVGQEVQDERKGRSCCACAWADRAPASRTNDRITTAPRTAAEGGPPGRRSCVTAFNI